MIHGLNRHYYSIAINYRKNELEEKMLLNLHKKKWTDGLSVSRFDEQEQRNEKIVKVLQTTRLHETHTHKRIWQESALAWPVAAAS